MRRPSPRAAIARPWRLRRGAGFAVTGFLRFGAFVILVVDRRRRHRAGLSPYNPATVDVTARLRPPSSLHWLGTDVLGRDVFTRLIYGARISLTTGIVVVLVGAVIGTLVGGIAAYVRGRLEELIMRLTDLVLCFPPIILAMAIAAALGIGTTNTIIAMLVVWWPKFARLAAALFWCSARRNMSRQPSSWGSAPRAY